MRHLTPAVAVSIVLLPLLALAEGSVAPANDPMQSQWHDAVRQIILTPRPASETGLLSRYEGPRVGRLVSENTRFADRLIREEMPNYPGLMPEGQVLYASYGETFNIQSQSRWTLYRF